jgi:hypothetical protein
LFSVAHGSGSLGVSAEVSVDTETVWIAKSALYSGTFIFRFKAARYEAKASSALCPFSSMDSSLPAHCCCSHDEAAGDTLTFGYLMVLLCFFEKMYL